MRVAQPVAFGEGDGRKLLVEMQYESLGEMEKYLSEFFASDYWKETSKQWRTCFEPDGSSRYQYRVVI